MPGAASVAAWVRVAGEAAAQSALAAFSTNASTSVMSYSLRREPVRENAAFVVLMRNSELNDWLVTMRNLEDRFNHRYNYPYVFLNEVEFTEEAKTRISVSTAAEVKFGLVPEEFWGYPPWYSAERAKAARDRMRRDRVFHGDQESYHHMCRFNSGFFYRHPLVQNYEFYWRVEPSVKFHCDMEFDPFAFMKRENKVYSFTISFEEIASTIPTLWQTLHKFQKDYPEYVVKDNFMKWITDSNGNYNLCHFWSNFEIARLDFYNSPAYQAFFDYLDRANGFFEERWGDAPVHTMAAAMFLHPDQVHFWDEIGYTHDSITQCPMNPEVSSKCDCGKVNPAWTWKCPQRWMKMFGPPKSARA